MTETLNVGRMSAAISLVTLERYRQFDKWGQDPLKVEAPDTPHEVRLRVLGEEYGEVCKALNERDTEEHLLEEVIQCAAVCVAWIEGMLGKGNHGSSTAA